MENDNHFAKKNCIVFNSIIMQNDGPKPKIFWMKGALKHPMNAQLNQLSTHVAIIN